MAWSKALISSACLFSFLPYACAHSYSNATTSILFSGGTVIGFDASTESLQVFRNGSVLVTNDKIAAITDGPYTATLPHGTEVVDITGNIITTGFIDTHRHGWQTAFKTIASNTSLAEYFARYGEFAMAVQEFTPEDVYIGQLAGTFEAMNAGVTTILDHAHHTWSDETAEAGLQASIDSGARVFWCYAFHNIPNNFTFDDQIANFRDIQSNGTFKGTSVSVGIAYDSFSPGIADQTAEVISLAKLVPFEPISLHTHK
jgi:cytosine/adenosine deaminase-related metal-dependent hydrolase